MSFATVCEKIGNPLKKESFTTSRSFFPTKVGKKTPLFLHPLFLCFWTFLLSWLAVAHGAVRALVHGRSGAGGRGGGPAGPTGLRASRGHALRRVVRLPVLRDVWRSVR